MMDEHVICLSNWNQLKSMKELQTENREIFDPDISFIVLCKEEERCIGRCIQSIQNEFAEEDEIIVIDTGSTDNSINIVSQIEECRLIKTKWENDFSMIRNIGINLATKTWIFFIDADEILIKGSIKNLKKFLMILDDNSISNVIISPLIVNSNLHVIREVKRIFKKNDGIFYYGCIHEEPRKNIEKSGSDLIHLFLDNVVLEHDGYKREIVKLKDKANRNTDLLKKMVCIEPQNPRWKYFLSRDGRSSINGMEYEYLLKEVIQLSSQEPIYLRYRIRATSDLISYFIDSDRLNEADILLNELEKLDNDLSDVVYYRHFIKYVKCKKESMQIFQSLVECKKKYTDVEYGGIHSSYFHIEFLMGLLLFDLGEYQRAFQIYHHLEVNEFIDSKKMFENLYNQMTNLFEE